MQALHSLAPLLISGADARNFLQGQLSNDLQLLNARRSLLTSCNSAQGRVQAILTLLEYRDGVLLLLPRSLLDTTAARLRKYVLRAKVVIDAADLSLYWANRDELAGPISLAPGECAPYQDGLVLRWPDAQQVRYLLLKPGQSNNDSATDMAWQLADIRAGLPQVVPETYEHFVAQMLNLDTLGGISFEKGCYTGQEIIARAHYRGTVKRRMFRFAATTQAPLPGARILQTNEPAGEVVSAADADGGCELLAVISLAQQAGPLRLEGSDAALAPLPLPYPSVG